MSDFKSIIPAEYGEFLTGLKQRIRTAHITAARAVNRELILLYWDIGQAIAEKQKTANWGDGVVEQIAADLRAEFPDMRGFSNQNVWRMKQLYLDHTSDEFLSQAVRELKHLPKSGKPDFLQQAVAEMSDRKDLDQPVPEILAQAVRELVAAVPWGHHANVLAKLTDHERGPDDQPSIGIILCAEKDDVEVEYALKSKSNPIGVAEYQLQTRLPAEFKGKLPTTRQLSDAVRRALPQSKKAR